MDKKKVKEHIQRALIWIDPMTTESANYETAIEMAAKNLEFAMEELSKSDWVSVEDGLPEYEEVVDVRIDCGECGDELDKHLIIYAATHRVKSKNDCKHLRFDKNGFIIDYNFETITHWRPIEKLEE